MRLVFAALAGTITFAMGGAALAVDGVSVEYGQSNSSNADVRMGRIGLQWNWSKRWLEGADWHVGGFWDLGLGYWDNRSAAKTNSSITEIGMTPTLRLQQNSLSGIAPYLEGGLGAHLLSQTSVSPQRAFGSSLQFGSHAGFGIRFGPKGAYDLGYRYQHLSNGGIKQPNQGINFNELRFQYHF